MVETQTVAVVQLTSAVDAGQRESLRALFEMEGYDTTTNISAGEIVVSEVKQS